MIVDNISLIKKHVPAMTADAIGFAELETYVSAAESWFKNNIAGQELYDFVDSHKTNSAVLPLVSRMERIIALKAFGDAVPALNLILTSAGFGVTNNEKIAPASKERVADLCQSLHTQCSEAVEDLLMFLENDDTYKDKWQKSPSYSLFTDSFLTTFEQFKAYAPYGESVAAIFPKNRMDFTSLRGKIRAVMAGKITAAASKEIVSNLLEKMKSKTLSDKQMQLLESLRFALGAYTLGLNETGDDFINQARSIIKNNPDVFENSKLDFAASEWTDKPIINLC
ncbi:MAG: hypothetical protein LBP63_01950 [Prevotellaceae bacterium]|jgi:hypothetical protein|nr:hypothetical protein [Prevotellaceae bacterium]